MNAIGYLNHVNIDDNSKNDLLLSLCQNLRINELSEIKNSIRAIVSTILPLQQTCTNKKEWVECNKTCYSNLSDLIDIEVGSTAYMLRTIFNSLIPSNYNQLELFINGNLSGIWNEDYDKITITRFGNDSPRRLILGLGPSACGKTYWAKTLIQIFTESSPQMPDLFLSVDGGIQRESSIIYQYVLDVAKEACILGFANLVSTSYFSKSLFNSSVIKSDIVKFIQKQQPISLYVPETLSECGTLRPQSCLSKIKKYINITQDNNWISILIYQHRTGVECTYPIGYKCVGCSIAGKQREIKEGKKYSDKMYLRSLNESVDFLSKSYGMKFIIHNSGSSNNRSIVDDFTDYTTDDPITASISQNLLKNANKYFYTLFPHSPDEPIAINTNTVNNQNTKSKKQNSFLQINANAGEFYTNLIVNGRSTRVRGKKPRNLIGGKTRRKLKKHD